MADSLPTLTSISEALDSLGLAMCVFDAADAPLLWNRTFLAFFPEHAEQLRLGGAKPFSLRQFYERRRGLIDIQNVNRYLPRAMMRQAEPQRPYAFDHQGVKLWVASLPLPGVGSAGSGMTACPPSTMSNTRVSRAVTSPPSARSTVATPVGISTCPPRRSGPRRTSSTALPGVAATSLGSVTTMRS